MNSLKFHLWNTKINILLSHKNHCLNITRVISNQIKWMASQGTNTDNLFKFKIFFWTVERMSTILTSLSLDQPLKLLRFSLSLLNLFVFASVIPSADSSSNWMMSVKASLIPSESHLILSIFFWPETFLFYMHSTWCCIKYHIENKSWIGAILLSYWIMITACEYFVWQLTSWLFKQERNCYNYFFIDIKLVIG